MCLSYQTTKRVLAALIPFHGPDFNLWLQRPRIDALSYLVWKTIYMQMVTKYPAKRADLFWLAFADQVCE
jgi:hypothetical protein